MRFFFGEGSDVEGDAAGDFLVGLVGGGGVDDFEDGEDAGIGEGLLVDEGVEEGGVGVEDDFGEGGDFEDGGVHFEVGVDLPEPADDSVLHAVPHHLLEHGFHYLMILI